MRQQEKIYAYARLTLKAFDFDHYVFPSLLILLIYFRDYNSELYKQISERRLTPQELFNEFPKKLIKYDEDGKRFFAPNLFLLLYFYNNYYAEINYKTKLLNTDGVTPKEQLLIKTSLDDKFDEELVASLIKFDRSNYYGLKLDHLLNAINLTRYFQ